MGLARRLLFRPRRPEVGSCRLSHCKAYVGEVVRLCGLRRLRDAAALRLFRDAYENCGGL